MNHRDLRPLSAAAARKVDWVAAHHEVRINDVVLAWHADATANNPVQQTLTYERQSELQNLLIEMAIHLCEAEGREYLTVSSSPRQFEIEIAAVMDAIADETGERWCSLARDFNLDPLSPQRGQPDCDFHRQVRKALMPAARGLIRDAWSAHERRLATECACPIEEHSGGARQAALVRTAPANRHRLELAVQKIERLRIDKGLSFEELAVEARLDKKTVAAVIEGRRHARINTVKKLADALGVKASELTS